MTGVAALAGVSTRVLIVGITGGGIEFGTTHSNTFGTPAVATPSGGSGSYSYAWAFLPGYAQVWTFVSGQGTSSVVVKVSSVFPGEGDSANVDCVVTDTITGKTATSTFVTYGYSNVL